MQIQSRFLPVSINTGQGLFVCNSICILQM